MLQFVYLFAVCSIYSWTDSVTQDSSNLALRGQLPDQDTLRLGARQRQQRQRADRHAGPSVKRTDRHRFHFSKNSTEVDTRRDGVIWISLEVTIVYNVPINIYLISILSFIYFWSLYYYGNFCFGSKLIN
jgi:hypothetical protein